MSKVRVDLDEIVGERAIAGIWFRTKRMPWYMRYVGPGSLLEFFLVAPLIVYHYLRPANPTDTETLLDYSGPIYCARTCDEFVFIVYQEDAERTSRLLRRFPSSALRSCDYEHTHATAVKFQFDSGECSTLHYEGVWSDLAEFITPGSAFAEPTES